MTVWIGVASVLAPEERSGLGLGLGA
jgi:hypothetical protein